MIASEIPPDRFDLEMLDGFLLSESALPNGMALSDLDGFLTGIAVRPELVMPSEWLPVIWGGEEPAFADQDEAQAVLGAVMGRYGHGSLWSWVAIMRFAATLQPMRWIPFFGSTVYANLAYVWIADTGAARCPRRQGDP
jgi:hypothetical protein